MDTSKAAGMDQIPVKILKEAADILAYTLVKIVKYNDKGICASIGM